jgi:type II secretory pathway pseudopilin PulG
LKKRRETALREAGFSLLEFVISLGFMASLSGLIAGSSFLALKTNHETGARADVAVATATSTRWLVRDIHRARATPPDLPTTLGDGDPAVSTATFSWDDGGPVDCAYYVSGTDLVRDCGGANVGNVARFISGLQFTRVGDLVTVVYTITPTNAPDASEQISLSVALGGG